MDSKINASIISGITEVVVTHPIDYIKTIKQSNTSIYVFKKNPYKGVGGRLLGVIPMRILFWNSLDYCHNNNFSSMKTAIAVSTTQTFLDYPIEQIKIQKMLYNTPVQRCFIPKTLLPGFSVNLARNFGFAYIMNVCIIHKNKNDGNDFIYGAMGGLCGAFITHPLDTLKTYYQHVDTYKLPKYSMRDYFKGCTYRCSISLIAMSIGWTIFSKFK